MKHKSDNAVIYENAELLDKSVDEFIKTCVKQHAGRNAVLESLKECDLISQDDEFLDGQSDVNEKIFNPDKRLFDGRELWVIPVYFVHIPEACFYNLLTGAIEELPCFEWTLISEFSRQFCNNKELKELMWGLDKSNTDTTVLSEVLHSILNLYTVTPEQYLTEVTSLFGIDKLKELLNDNKDTLDSKWRIAIYGG